MILGAKHLNQRSIIKADFSGGLNTSSSIEALAENQLAGALNVEVDQSNGRLRTVAGTTDIINHEGIAAAVYDDINETLLLVMEDRKVYAADIIGGRIGKQVGILSGDLYPVATSWEDGLLIASGDKLQYFRYDVLETIADSPICTSVFVRAGRVMVTDENNAHYSGVGDETNWTDDTNDYSSAKFAEIGYKDGGKILNMISLSSDVLFVKNNRRLYRLSGEYPDWSISEVSRNMEARNRLGMCAVADSVFIIGHNGVYNIQTTSDYGDMKPTNVAKLITAEIQNLPANAMLRYMPSLNQIWAIAGEFVLMFDLVTQSWYKRQFNTPVIDAVSVGDEVMIIKADRVSKLDILSSKDAGQPLSWWWKAQRLLSENDYFLKRVQVTFTPEDMSYSEGKVRVGQVTITLPSLDDETTKRRLLTSTSQQVFGNSDSIYGNPNMIFQHPTILVESRNVYRNKFLDISGSGVGGRITFNEIRLTVTEV